MITNFVQGEKGDRQMRLIDADALDMYECLRSYYGDAWRDAQKAIDDAPTVDPVKHGHWKRTDILFCRQNAVRCSCCGHLTPTYGKVLDSFCRFCGAKMDEVEENG